MNKKFKNQTLNVGNPSEPIKIRSLIKKISLITNTKKKYSFKNVKNQSIKKRIPDIKKLKLLVKKRIKFTKLKKGLNIIYEKIKIDNKEISDSNYPFFVAEAGINYDGNFEKCF